MIREKGFSYRPGDEVRGSSWRGAPLPKLFFLIREGGERGPHYPPHHVVSDGVGAGYFNSLLNRRGLLISNEDLSANSKFAKSLRIPSYTF